MRLVEAERLARYMMLKNGLIKSGWVFMFDRATSRLGATHFAKKKITVSRRTSEVATREEFEQLMFHEIAHALLPSKAGHGPEWKALSAKLGYAGKRLLANPYQHPRKHPQRTTRAAPPVSAERSGVVVGDNLRLPSGEMVVVMKAARTRFHLHSPASNKRWTIPFGQALQFKIS